MTAGGQYYAREKQADQRVGRTVARCVEQRENAEGCESSGGGLYAERARSRVSPCPHESYDEPQAARNTHESGFREDLERLAVRVHGVQLVMGEGVTARSVQDVAKVLGAPVGEPPEPSANDRRG